MKFNQKLALFFGLILCITSIFLSIKMILNVPRDLGAQLEYVGSRETGCKGLEWVLFFGFCPRETIKIFYFATNLNKDELKNHFKNNKATYIDSPSLGGTFYSDEEDYTSDTIDFKFLSTQEEFYIEYYDKKEAVVKSNELRRTDKKYVISLTEENYKLAKDAL